MTCESLHAFADGELDPDEAAAFAPHLADCIPCQRELHVVLQLVALPQPRPAGISAPQVVSVTPIAWYRTGKRAR